jgi:hypothetical protein
MRDLYEGRDYMKFMYINAVVGLLFFVILFSGCTSTSPPVKTPASIPTTAMVILSPTQTPTAVFLVVSSG